MRLFSAVALGLLSASLHAAPAKPPAAKTAATPAAQGFLPETFAGWNAAPPAVSSNAQAADAANASVLSEYGFTTFESDTYTRDANTLSVRAMQFADASGAFGAYTFYRRDGMVPVEVGTRAAFDGGKHILFWQSGIVVDAVFKDITAMSMSDLREMAAALPKISGGAGLAPPMINDLPTQGLDRESVRYTLGPLAYTRAGGVLPAGIINFARGEEAITAHYGDGQLTLINCPTPQIAKAQLDELNKYLAEHNAAGATQQLNDSSSQSLKTRRSGPLVAMTSGALAADQASRVLNSVHYDADVIVNRPQGYVGEGVKTAKLLIGIISLVFVLLSITLFLGFFFGGGRVLLRRLRGKPPVAEESDMIRLNLQ